MNFDTVGPFPFDPFSKDKNWQKKFWLKVKGDRYYLEHLETAAGCYVYCLRKDTSVLPWYVGKTNGEKGFKQEVFTNRNLRLYMGASRNPSKGTSEIIFFPLVTEKFGKISTNKAGCVRAIEWLETTLITMSIDRNPKTLNVAKTKFYRTVWVNGIIGTGKRGPLKKPAKYVRENVFDLY